MKKFVLIFLSFPLLAQDWSLVENMAPTGSEQSDFGVGMVFADDYLVVGWPKTFENGLTQNTSADSCGEVITYEKVDGKFEPMAVLTAEDLTGACVEGDGFGYSLAFDNGRLAIGMPAGARAGTGRSGGASDADSRVFLTHFENGNWVLDETLIADDLGNGHGMGFNVVLEDDVLLVHAHSYDSIYGFYFVASYGVYVFEDSGSGFSQVQKLEENYHLYGQTFDYENGQIVVGAWGEQALTQPGQVYIYDKQGASWQLSQTIADSRNSNLGNVVQIDGNLMAVAAVQAGGTGSVSIYENQGGQWQERQFIQADDAAFNDQFGISVRIKDNELFVGATGGTDSGMTSGENVGAVYHYLKQADGQFVQVQKIESYEPNEGNDQFGSNLIFNDTDLLVSEVSGGTLEGASTEFVHYSRTGSVDPGPDPVTSYNVSNKASGVWQVAGVDNQSINLQIMPDARVLMYGNANANGAAVWLVGLGTYSGNSIDFEHIYTTSGARFGADFNAAEVLITDSGSAVVSFSECAAGEFIFDLAGFGSNQVDLVKTLEVPGNQCGVENKMLPNGISGSWFDPARSGEGYTVYVYQDAGVEKAQITWYTYNQSGQQLTLQGIGNVVDQSIVVDTVYASEGAAFLSGESTLTQMGSLSMTWNECRVAEVSYDLTQSNLGTGNIQVQQLSNLANTDCGELTKGIAWQ